MSCKTWCIVGLLSMGLIAPLSYAKDQYHATTKEGEKKIKKEGFSSRKMDPDARFGKGVYLSDSEKLARKEKPKAETVIKFKDSKTLNTKTINTKKMSNEELKKFSGDKDLRGNIHKGTPGGDLAKKMGKEAGNKGYALTYPSSKGKGMNTFIPKKVYEEHPKIVTPAR